MSVLSWICSPEFQSTLPRRERPEQDIRYAQEVQFQSTLPRRERLRPLKDSVQYCQFQSTLPRRERLHRRRYKRFYNYFNPRSREGSDKPSEHGTLAVDISIHAPAKGATSTASLSRFIFKFQSTLPRRERLRRATIADI